MECNSELNEKVPLLIKSVIIKIGNIPRMVQIISNLIEGSPKAFHLIAIVIAIPPK